MAQFAMTRLEDYVWRNLSFRRRLAGRVVVNRIIKRAVKKWPVSPSEKNIGAVAESIEQEEVGFVGIILVYVIGAIVAEVVHLIFEWWKDSDRNKALMEAYQR